MPCASYYRPPACVAYRSQKATTASEVRYEWAIPMNQALPARTNVERFLQRLLAVRPSAYLIVLVPILIGLVRIAIESLWMTLEHSFNLLLFYALTQLLMVGAMAL